MKEYDIAVIGGGPGGYVAAIKAAQAGACVCLVEQDRVGGTCLNRGCIPTKAYFSTAQLLRKLQHAEDHGVLLGEVSFDFAAAAERKNQVVDKLVGGIEQLLKGNKVDLFRGLGSFEGPGQLAIRRPELTGHIRARKVIIASGSLPAVPKSLPFDGRNVLTSTEILAIKELPERLLVIGGGYIGCEFASIFATFGSQVTVVEALPRILATSDRQMAREVEKSFREQGVTLHLETSVQGLEIGTDTVVAKLSSGEEVGVDKVLVAVGRRPNSDGLGLETIGLATERGAIQVNERMETAVPGVYAIGDVTGGIQLAHVASYQAEIAVANALGGDRRADYRVVPSAIFAAPEVAQVGLNEEQCKEQGLNVSIGRFAYQATSKALCEGETQGSFKLIADAETGAILGAAVAGAEASTLIAEATAAMAAGMTAHQLGSVIHAHPTLPEMIKEAAEDVDGVAVHKVGRRK